MVDTREGQNSLKAVPYLKDQREYVKSTTPKEGSGAREDSQAEA